MADYDDLRERAAAVRDETGYALNTARRVGSLLLDMVGGLEAEETGRKQGDTSLMGSLAAQTESLAGRVSAAAEAAAAAKEAADGAAGAAADNAAAIAGKASVQAVEKAAGAAADALKGVTLLFGGIVEGDIAVEQSGTSKSGTAVFSTLLKSFVLRVPGTLQDPKTRYYSAFTLGSLYNSEDTAFTHLYQYGQRLYMRSGDGLSEVAAQGGGTSALEARVTELAERLEALTARVAALETGGTGGGGAVWE